MIEKAIPKTSIKVKVRRSSCLYPSFASKQRKHLLFGFGSMQSTLTEDGSIIFAR